MTTARIATWLQATTALTSAVGLTLMTSGDATANPVGGQVVAGEAVISAPNATTVQIDQSSPNAIVNWQTFNIGAGETTRFVQPDASAWTLNRVTGAVAPSVIIGTIEANGNVAIVNPDGILFGQGARVDVGGLIATTHDIANDDFMAGRFRFTTPGNPSASIVNEGTISIADYGLAAFVAPGVRNAGVITARMGRVALASGNAFTLDLYGDDLIRLEVDDEIAAEVIDVATGQLVTDLVENEGTISASGGTVALKAATARRAVNSVINNTGVIEANSVGKRGGKIVLGAGTAGTKRSAAPIQRVKVSGTLSAKNIPTPTPRPDDGPGGRIEITGEMIEVAAATIDASGTGGGGIVLIGGDYMGGRGDPATIANYGIRVEAAPVPTARYVAIGTKSTIKADALVNGDGGKVVVWADESTSFSGAITARGAGTGNGGFAETSGTVLVIGKTANVSTLASSGKTGTWLLDPNDFTVAASGGNITGGLLSSQLAGNNVVISTAAHGTAGGNGDIFVDDVVSWSSNLLTFRADRNIVVKQAMDASGGGQLALEYAQSDADGDYIIDLGRIDLGSSSTFSTKKGGDPTLNYTIITSLGAEGSTTGLDLQGIGGNLSNNYALGTDISAASAATWNGGQGFDPIGDSTNAFVGRFTGLGHVISGIAISRSASHSGLFAQTGNSGLVRDIGIVGGTVSGGNVTGALVGWNAGTVHRSFSTTPVSGRDDTGGLVGFNDSLGTIEDSFATGDVSGRQGVGGVVGYNGGGTVETSFATGDVSGIRHIGGLAGVAGGSISQSFSTGAVSGLSNVGGLVGFSDATILESYATGPVTGVNGHPGDVVMPAAEINTNIGGLVGVNSGSLEGSYATGAVTGGALVGGLIGTNNLATISDSYATGDVSGNLDRIGGLVGDNAGGQIERSYATGDITAPSAMRVGGLTGYNDGTLSESFAVGSVIGDTYVGGLSGGNAGVIEDTFALGGVTGANSFGGLVGYNVNSILRSYSAGLVVGTGADVGGFVGTNDFGASIHDSFFDANTSGQIAACGQNNGLCDATALSTAQMKTAPALTGAGWDFTTIWIIDPAINDGYPYLRLQVTPPTPFTLNPLPPVFAATVNPFQPTILLTGTGFTNITEIRWTWVDPNGNTGTVIWNASNSFGGSRFQPGAGGTSATASPVLVALGDPVGTYHWSITVIAGGQQVTNNFAVNYLGVPPVVPTPPSTPIGPGLPQHETPPPIVMSVPKSILNPYATVGDVYGSDPGLLGSLYATALSSLQRRTEKAAEIFEFLRNEAWEFVLLGLPGVLPTYGRYGGKAWSSGDFYGDVPDSLQAAERDDNTRPINSLDELFYAHDLAYKNASTSADIAKADITLLNDMISLYFTALDLGIDDREFLIKAVVYFAYKQAILSL